MSAEDIEIETIPGLPGELPEGERVLWQGRPAWRSLARHTFKVRLLTGYFAAFALLRAVVGAQRNEGVAGIGRVLGLSALAAGCLGLLSLIAYLYARGTIYTITTQRVVMRIGVAVPMTWNLPFKRIAAADLKVRKDGDGDISLQLTSPNRIGWLHLWPHVMPWQFVRARPTLRTIEDPARVAAILGDAVSAWSGQKLGPAPVSAPVSQAPAPAQVAA